MTSAPSEDYRRLSAAAIRGATPSTRRPTYDRTQVSTGLVHLGLGAFARAHLCLATEDLLEAGESAWGIAGASLRSPDQRDKLAPQDFLYTALERDGEGDRARIVGCLTDVCVATEDPAALVRLLARPETRVVSLTVTEKGYCHRPADGRLDTAHGDIHHDTYHLASPRSAVGFLVAGLDLRRRSGAPPFTVLCCDNLPSNGPLVARLVQDFALLTGNAALASWLESYGAFPATMVDRIVPATTAADLAAAVAATGLLDAAPVVHEPFRQWVIEDVFVDGVRPPWERSGAQLVADVAPFEHMKLRLLNASHSALAYLGYLAGHETIGDAVADAPFRDFVRALWQAEIIPVTPPPPGTDLAAYTGSLLARYANPAIRHRTWQIAMDGSQKLPQRLLATVRERLARGLTVDRLALAVAAWMIYVGGRDLDGRPIDVLDPLAGPLRDAVAGAKPDAASQVDALLGFTAVFGDLAGPSSFRDAVVDGFDRLRQDGARGAVARFV